MKNQFFYTRKEEDPVRIEGQGPIYKEYIDSFNLDMVIRTISLEDGRRLVLLNDIHERLERVPQFDTKKKKVVGQTKERNTFQSEIFLSPEDSLNFMKAVG